MTAVPLSDSLDRLLKLADPQPGWRMLEFSSEAATIRHFAPQLGEVVSAGSLAEVESATFPAAAFDLLLCRQKAHQVADAFRFMLAAHRALKPGGVLLIEDILAPEDEAAARYVNAFLKFSQRDHVRAYADYEWEGLALDTGFVVAHRESAVYPVALRDWAAWHECSPFVVERLHILLHQAPESVAAWLRPRCPGTADAAFDQHSITLKMVKPG